MTPEHASAVSLLMHEGSGFSCATTGSDGFEQEILRLRNANRDSPETLEYIDWRYQSSRDAPEPRVFWLLSQDGQRIGMASVVFRPYWINGARVQTAVVGDISLDSRWRGRGLGQLLLQFMTSYLDEHFPQLPAFVIPTEAARRALAGVGWVTRGALVRHVYVLDFTRYVRVIVRSGWLAKRIASQIRRLARALARARAPRDGSLHFKDALDESLFEFARRAPPVSDCAVHDTGPEALKWRYAQHPNTRFTFATFSRSGEVCGFLVFEDSTLAQTCSIYELVARTPADMRAMLALFILRGLSTPDLITLRVLLDDRHPHRTCLRRLGFIARRPEAVLQVHSPSGTAERLAWCVTQGDKDT